MYSKPIFDAVRTMLGRGFYRDEVEALDTAIAVAIAAGPPRDLTADSPECNESERPGRVGAAGLALIRKWEGCAKRLPDGRFEAYPDPGTGGDPWTIGWGSTGKDIVSGLIWTQEECDDRLAHDVARYAADVARAIGDAPTTQNQFDALVAFHYNTGAIFRATLTRRHCAGDHAGALAEFGKWINAGGRPMNGLKKRRADEAALYGTV